MNACKAIFLNPKKDNSEFRCDICNNYLSIPPILFNDSVGNVCGRCNDDGETENFDSEVFQVQKVYENIANYIIFPCSYHYNGCNKKLKWSGVRQHEELCVHKDAFCPLSYQKFLEGYEEKLEGICEWKGTSEDLVSHLRSSHENCISSTNQMTILPTQSNFERILFSEVNGIFTIMILNYLIKKKRYYCNVLIDFSFKDCKMYQYDLEIFDKTEKKCLILPGNKVESLDKSNLTKEISKYSLEINSNIIEEFSGESSSIILRFKLMKVYKGKTEPLDSGDIRQTDQETCIINNLKCSCGKFLFSPVYICQKGHNCCGKCKSSYGYCRTCKLGFMSKIKKNTITYLTNTTLETVTFLTKYPCMNKPKGCIYTADFNQLAIHQENCVFTEKDCLLKCGWKGMNTEMYKHIRSNHSPLQFNKENTYDPHLKSECYPILFDNNIFMLTIEYTIGNSLFIMMQCLGMDEWKYEFKFTILSSCESINLVMTHLCQPLSFGLDKKQTSIREIEYPFRFISQFLTDYNNIKFKINISKLQN